MQLATIRSILKAIKKTGHRTTCLLLYITNDYELDITYKLYYTKHIRSLARVVASDTGLDSFQLPSPFLSLLNFKKSNNSNINQTKKQSNIKQTKTKNSSMKNV